MYTAGSLESRRALRLAQTTIVNHVRPATRQEEEKREGEGRDIMENKKLGVKATTNSLNVDGGDIRAK